MGASAGYAVLVQGKISNSEGILSHNKTTNRIYNALRQRGFLDENIMYFNYNTTQGAAGVAVDALPSKGDIQAAVSTWAKAKMNGSPAPLYFIVVNHGNANTFHLDTDIITPADVNLWLDNLEAGLTEAARLEKRIFIDGSCYSGSFIPTVSKHGRIVISSASADEESYKGTMEPDGIRSGEFFLDALFERLKRGANLREAFDSAAGQTRVYTRKGGLSANSGVYGDSSVQHPLLEDNGDGKGSNSLSSMEQDGAASTAVYLGVGQTVTNAAAGPADISRVPATQFLPATADIADIWLTTPDAARVEAAWVEIRKPALTLSAASGNALQVDIDLEKKLLARDTASGKWLPLSPYPFVDAGMYELYYYTQDVQTHEKTPMVRAVVYKDAAGNRVPGEAAPTAPAGGEKVRTSVIFKWSPAVDPDGDAVSYTLEIATDAAFTTIVHREEELTVPQVYVLDGVLKDVTDYHWRVRTVDRYGASSAGQSSTFSTDNTNGIPGILTGYVRSSGSGLPIAGASIVVAGLTYKTAANGAYLVLSSVGSTSMAITAPGYAPKSVTSLVVTAGSVLSNNIYLSPGGTSMTGDCDGNGSVSIAEVQTAINMFLGLKSALSCVDQDNSGAVTISEVQKSINSYLGL